MANTKTAKKNILINKRNRIRNVAIMSRTRTYLKKARLSIAKASDNPEEAKNSFRLAMSEIEKCEQKGVIHRNKARRIISRMQRHLSKNLGYNTVVQPKKHPAQLQES